MRSIEEIKRQVEVYKELGCDYFPVSLEEIANLLKAIGVEVVE